MALTPSIGLLLFCIFLSIQVIEAAKKSGVYKNSYVYLTALNKATGEELQLCGNYQQYRTRRIAEAADAKDAIAYPLHWWNSGRANDVSLCESSSGDISQSLVPLAFHGDVHQCSNLSRYVSLTPIHVIKELNAQNPMAGLLLMDKGVELYGNTDYLFGDFYVPIAEDNKSVPIFYIYREQFEQIKALSPNISELTVTPHRPPSSDFDLSLVLIWLLAMFSVSIGGVWAFLRHKAGKDVSLATLQTESEWCNKYGVYITIPVIIAFACGMLLLGFFFRFVIVIIFNVMLVFLGAVAMHGCVRALLSHLSCLTSSALYKAEISCLRSTCCFSPEHPFTYFSLFLYLLCLSFTLTWYFIRLHPYAFILLDVIDVCVCLHVLKTLRLPNLKWIAFLMIGMFVYDFFMVFVTPYITADGCSIMLEVATGQGCRKRGAGHTEDEEQEGYPMAPALVKTPERFPVLIQVPHFDPLFSCIDPSIDSFRMSMLGLGDIIIPGYIIVHGFTMHGIGEKTRIKYGLVCLCGYGIGLIVTFVALLLMDTAQPALIYLVPCTLIPNFLYALIRGEFCKVWNGLPITDNKLIQMTNEIGETEVMTTESEQTNSGSGSERSAESARV